MGNENEKAGHLRKKILPSVIIERAMKTDRRIWILSKTQSHMDIETVEYIKQALLYSWRLSRYNAPIHWPVHGHMTSNNETVSRQTP